MRQTNLVLDLYNILICVVLIICLRYDGRWEKKRNTLFTFMCICNMGMLIGDITNWTCEGHEQVWFPAALRLGSVCFFSCSAPLLLSFLNYVDTFLIPEIPENRVLWKLACLLTAAQLAGSVLSLWNGWFFWIGADNVYRRGSFFLLSQICPMLIYAMIVWMSLRSCKKLCRKRVLFLLVIVALPFIAQGIQNMNYGVALMNTGITLSLLFMFIQIQSERGSLMQRQKDEIAEVQMDMMMSQIYPHFLYNNLAVIRELCTSDPVAASEAVGDLSRFLHTNMKFITNKNPVPVEQELAHVRQYLNLQKKRFGARMHVVYDITVSDFWIPPLTLQPIAENAVRHGIAKRAEGGTVTIRTGETALTYLIIVEDDGPGFLPEARHLTNYRGVGIENVKKRLRVMCNGSVEIDSKHGNGTTVTITIAKNKNIKSDKSK